MTIHTNAIAAAMFTAACLTASANVPQITERNMAQEQTTRMVTITYTLADAPAVVTLDVQTNCVVGTVTNWASIGGHALWNASGDVWKRVETGPHTITWQPVDTWPGHSIPDGGARAVITAWATNNTPDYMVVDLTDVPDADRFRYYPGADFLPRANFAQTGDPATGNPIYKTSKLLMRKIMARGVEWTMGAESDEWGYMPSNELTHYARLTNNYYIGVFEITQRQWALVATNSTIAAKYQTEGAMRPMTGMCYNEIRNTANETTADPTHDWPAKPALGSFLGLLRTKTGLDFDLPTEAQWELAARAGNGSGYWNDGSLIVGGGSWTAEQAELSNLARYLCNGGRVGGVDPDESCGPTNGTAIVGSYAPNSWGLYDTIGNAAEWCLDFYEADIATAKDADGALYAGRLNINPADSTLTLGGENANGLRVSRGGSYQSNPRNCRLAYRLSLVAKNRYLYAGLRVVCTSGLE